MFALSGNRDFSIYVDQADSPDIFIMSVEENSAVHKAGLTLTNKASSHRANDALFKFKHGKQ